MRAPLLVGSYSQSVKLIEGASVKDVSPASNPSFLLLRQFLYFVQENEAGRLVCLSRDYHPVNALLTVGKDPCHISANQSESLVVVTNYSSGNFIIYKSSKQRGLDSLLQNVKHQVGPGQEAHPHCSVFLDETRFLLCDLGINRVFLYKYGQDSLQTLSTIQLLGGPRTLALCSPERLLVSLELSSEIALLQVYPLKLVKRVSTTQSTQIKNYPSQVACSGKLAFLANRGENSVVTFQVDTLKVVKRLPVGDWPRHISVEGDSLLVACQKGGRLQQFAWEEDRLRQEWLTEKPSCAVRLDK